MSQHIGELLREKVKKSGMHISKIAEKMRVSRGQLYRLFKQKAVAPYYILRLGTVIHYDFTKDIPGLEKEALRYEAEEKSFVFRSEHQEQLLRLYKKYTALLEAHNYLFNFLMDLVKREKLNKKEIKHLLDRKAKLDKDQQS